MDEWVDEDDPKLRALFQYQLRDHVRHQDGRDSLAPTLVFVDADYEVGDGKCGLHTDAKSANEPAIVFVRADALVDAADRIEALAADRDYQYERAKASEAEKGEILALYFRAKERAEKAEASDSESVAMYHRARDRAGKAAAEKDAAVAAEREACAEVWFEYSKDHGTGAFDRHSAECERRIRARGNIDALEVVRQEARDDALKEAWKRARYYREVILPTSEKRGYETGRREAAAAIRALIPADQEGDE